MQEKEGFMKVVIRRMIILEKFLLSGIKVLISKPYWKDGMVVKMLFFSLILNIFIWVFLFNNRIESGDHPIILHYNLFFGVDYLGDYNKVYLIPLIGFIVILINSILGHILYAKEKLSTYFLLLNSFVIQIILLLASYLIINVN